MIRITRAGLVLAALLLPMAVHAAPPKGGPDLAQCLRGPEKGLEEGNGRTRPLPVPAPLTNIVRSRLDALAVVTLTGATFCVDARRIHTIEGMRLDKQARYLGFTWYGYEEYGHVLVDRTATGSAIDTGEPPVFSPSGKALAAVQQSGAGFGALEGTAIWRVLAQGVDRAAMFDDIPDMEDWRIDGWVGETCVDLSAIPDERMPESRTDLSGVPRQRFIATLASDGWRFEKTDKGCAAR